LFSQLAIVLLIYTRESGDLAAKLGDIDRDPLRLIAREQLGRRSPSRRRRKCKMQREFDGMR
jgi:hypothetical protein